MSALGGALSTVGLTVGQMMCGPLEGIKVFFHKFVESDKHLKPAVKSEVASGSNMRKDPEIKFDVAIQNLDTLADIILFVSICRLTWVLRKLGDVYAKKNKEIRDLEKKRKALLKRDGLL